MIANYTILLKNPIHCGTVELLRLFSLTLLVVFILRLAAHWIVFFRMRRSFTRYNEEEHESLIQIYRRAAQKAGVQSLPPLFKFLNNSPLVFTIGCWKPSIFLAPSVVDSLPPQELEASLVHELIHLKRKDAFLVWFLEIVLVSIPILTIQVFALSFVYSVTNSVYAILGALMSLIFFKAFLWERIFFLRELSCDDLSVSAIGEPLILASSIIRVWKLSKNASPHRWTMNLAFAQEFLPTSVSRLELRVRRLIDYKRPRIKFIVGKVLKVAAIVLLLLVVLFLWIFHVQNVQARLRVRFDQTHPYCKELYRR